MATIDGKALRRSFADAAPRSPPHPVRAFAGEARPVSGQVRVEGRSNGIAAVPTLLGMPTPKGRVVTAATGASGPAPPRRPALNVARVEPGKDAVRGKPKCAGWDSNFLPDMIRAAKPHKTIS